MSWSEFTEPERLYERIDTNQVGFLTRDEAARFGAGGSGARAPKNEK